MSHFTTVFLPKVFIFFHVHQMYLLHWGPYVWYVVEQVSGSRGSRKETESTEQLGIVG
jgi:hypothetical protein